MEERLRNSLTQRQKLTLSLSGIAFLLAALFLVETNGDYTNEGNVTVSVNQTMFFGTDFSNGSGASWENEGELYFQKNLTNNGTLSCGSCSSGVNYFNDADQLTQTLSGGQAMEMYDVVLNNTGNLQLEAELQIRNSFQFQNGDITTDRSNTAEFLHFEDNATYTGANDARHVNGYVGKTGNETFIFPVGDGATYYPLQLSASNPTDFFKVAYVSNLSGTAVFPGGSSFRADTSEGTIHTVHNREFWAVEGNSNTIITLTWDTDNNLNSLITDVSDLMVSGWNGSVWVNLGQNNLSGDVSSGSISSNAIDPNDYLGFTFARANEGVFPLEWLDIDVKAEKEDAILSWTTAWELGTDQFQIERSEKTQDGFVTIGELKASGNSTEITQYVFSDQGILRQNSQTLYYRIRQIDLDGKFSYSPVVELAPDKRISHFQFALFPNPAREYIIIEPQTTDNTELFFSLINMQGQTLLQQALQPEVQHRISLQEFPEGTYVIRLENEAHVETKTLVKR